MQDPWYCPRCANHKQALKKFDIWNCSDYLVVFLKRFSLASRWGAKIQTKILFPIQERLELTKYLPEGNGSFSLVSVIHHYGGMGSGHYTAYALNEASGKWYCFNDSSVHLVEDLQELLAPSAYVLFYKKVK